MIGRVVLCALAAFAASSAPLRAQSGLACTWENADFVRVEALASAQEDDAGRCVRSRGDLNGYTLSAERRRGLGIIEFNTIYAKFEDLALRQSFRDQPRRVQVLGVIGHDGAAFVTVTDTR